MTDTQSKDVWVFVEQRDGKPADVSLELLSKGRKLADELGGQLKSVCIAENAEEIAYTTFHYGADEALVVGHPALLHFRTIPYSRVLIKLIQEHQPRIVLFGATVIGRDIAPRAASATGSGLTADCTDLQISDVTYLKQEHKELLLQIRPAFGGNIIATIITPDTSVQMATVREGVMEMHQLDRPHDAKLTHIPYEHDPLDDVVEIVERHREESKVNLKGANIIVAGGYGMGSKESFELIHDLAHAVGGEVAGSRAAVDAGFIPRERQVGQTGTTVRPKLYIACGISGAIQHRAGMQEASKIVAINHDPDAPIFGIAHYGIVGDVREVIPKLLEVYKARLK